MCGIAGYIGSREIPEDRLNACLPLMRRRGPDHAAHRHWVNPSGRHVYLAHSRLSIIDLDPRSNQPFQVDRKAMVLNGELYNYVELKKDLESRSVRFTTSSDTEVLLRAIDRDGWSVLNRCEGMWAFALYDEKDGSLHLCRDRFGEKPLYMYRDDDGFYFASEPKFIAALLGRPLAINYDHLYRYMVNGYRTLYRDGHSFFKGLTELPSATHLRVKADGVEDQELYWQPSFNPADSMSYADAVAGVRERLIHSVKLRLRADVPLAFCMSGGVDSNSLISVAKRVLNYDVHGFTIVNTDARYEEQHMVDVATKELGIRHTAIPVNTADFLARLRTLVKYHDAPVYTISYYAHWLLMEAIGAHGYKIAVSGTAADELLTGYYDHHLAYFHEVRQDSELQAASVRNWEQHVKPLVLNPFLSNPNLFTKTPDFREHLILDAAEFARYMVRPWSEPFREERYTDSLLRNRMLNEMFVESVPVILHEDDLNAMYFSIENRSPFLDRDLFEFCYRIPSQHLIRDGRAKSVLRDAMAGIVPEEVRQNRRKVGFNAPIYAFLDVQDPAVRKELLGDSPIYDHVRRERIEQLISKPDMPNSESKFLFYFLNTKMFLEEFSS